MERRSERRLASLLTCIFFAGVAAVLVQPLFSQSSWLIFVQDDFLYYLKIAQNIAHGHGSTFNGIVSTNGYQPLWLLLLVGLSALTESPRLILAFLVLVNFLSAFATFLLARRLLRSASVRPLVVFAFAAWTTLYAVTLSFYCMETTLTVPLMLGVVLLLRRTSWLEQGPLHTFAFGMLLSAMVLSRIDTLIFGGLLLGGILIAPSLRALLRPRLVMGLGLGLLPVAGYFLLNRILFGIWVPVSGMAKEMKFGHAPSLEPWRVFFHPLAGSYAVCVVLALLILGTSWRAFSPIDRVVFASALAFPLLYYSILCCLSDWTLWGWYMYPLRLALCVSFLMFCLWAPLSQPLQKPLVAAVLVATVFAGLARVRWTRQQTDIYAASLEVLDFSKTHPGTYAMGDRAGRVAYLLPDPVVQTEGLVMDRAYLTHVARQAPLRQVLADYGVRYYIATAYQPFQGCFEAVEPAKAGPASAHMRGEFCGPPLATFFNDGIETLIFDVSKK